MKQPLQKRIKDYPNYVVTSDGDVYNTKYNRKLTPSPGSLGYLYTTLCKENAHKKICLQLLVAQAFVKGKTARNYRVRFKDHNKKNCKAENLEWCSHQMACKLGNTGKHGGLKGVLNPRSKLTENEVATIKKVYASKKASHRQLALKYKVSTTAIYKILKGLTWK